MCMPAWVWLTILVPALGLVPFAALPAAQGYRPVWLSLLMATMFPLALATIAYKGRKASGRLGESLYPPLEIATGTVMYAIVIAWWQPGPPPWDMLLFMVAWATAVVAVVFTRNWRRWPHKRNGAPG